MHTADAYSRAMRCTDASSTPRRHTTDGGHSTTGDAKTPVGGEEGERIVQHHTEDGTEDNKDGQNDQGQPPHA
jgi:hypothetical protein